MLRRHHAALQAGMFFLLFVLFTVTGINGAAARGQKLNLQEARAYMVGLINADRGNSGLAPVELDETASKAGQMHCEEMALAQYLSHWDLNGRKPDQRYSEAGGNGAVAENAALTGYPLEGQMAEPAKEQAFTRGELEQIERMFFNEVPPHDGHRRNILIEAHNKVGIGLTRVAPGGTIACTQEFVNAYAQFDYLPVRQATGKAIRMVGMLPKGVQVYSVDVRYERPPQPMTVRQLWQTYSYGYPDDRVAAFFPQMRHVQANRFEVTIGPDKVSKVGLYYLMVWVMHGALKAPIMTLSHTVQVE